MDVFSIVTSLSLRKKKIRFERRFSHSKEEENEENGACSLVWTKSGDALAMANSGKEMSLNVWSRVGTKLYAHESSLPLLDGNDGITDSAADVCVGTVIARAFTRSFLFDVGADLYLLRGARSSSRSLLCHLMQM